MTRKSAVFPQRLRRRIARNRVKFALSGGPSLRLRIDVWRGCHSRAAGQCGLVNDGLEAIHFPLEPLDVLVQFAAVEIWGNDKGGTTGGINCGERPGHQHVGPISLNPPAATARVNRRNDAPTRV